MNLFSPDSNDLEQLNDDPNISSYLEELTKPGGKFDKTKYKDEKEMYEAIAKGKYVGDNYIEHFKNRHDELKDDYKKLSDAYNAGPQLQELIDQIRSKQTNQPDSDPTLNANDDNKVPSTLDPKELESLINSKISEHEITKKQLENANLVKNKLQEKFGKNYQTALKQQIESMGLTEDFANQIARTHPQVFFKTFGLDQVPDNTNFQSPPTSSRRNDNFSPEGNKRTFSYYQKMRKEQPELYRSARIQDQMFKDAAMLGEAFQDGDWAKF